MRVRERYARVRERERAPAVMRFKKNALTKTRQGEDLL